MAEGISELMVQLERSHWKQYIEEIDRAVAAGDGKTSDPNKVFELLRALGRSVRQFGEDVAYATERRRGREEHARRRENAAELAEAQTELSVLNKKMSDELDKVRARHVPKIRELNDRVRMLQSSSDHGLLYAHIAAMCRDPELLDEQKALNAREKALKSERDKCWEITRPLYYTAGNVERSPEAVAEAQQRIDEIDAELEGMKRVQKELNERRFYSTL